ncbi:MULTISPECIES: ATP-binding protein [Bacillus]|uniref:ATP-binding protein n=1 Tax=Bacillus TaxID=1386 RepID=UPI000BB89A1C|nr:MULTISPECIES: sensor histidine kinase [Bacillus]
MDYVKDIILNLFFILFPILLYHSISFYNREKYSQMKRELIIFLHCAFAAILCMTFPIPIGNELQYDLRSIPIFVSIIYGGYISGFLTVLSILIYRAFLGGDEGMLATLIAIPFFVILPTLLHPYWRKFTKKKKLVLLLPMALIKMISSAIALSLSSYYYGLGMAHYDHTILHAAVGGAIFLITLYLCFLTIEYFYDVHQLQKQYNRAKKLQLVSELAASVAHEIRNPLTVVNGFIQLLGTERNKANQEYVPIILKELQTTEKVITNYLELASNDLSSAKPLGTKDLINTVFDSINTYSQNSNVQLVRSEKKNYRIRGDKEQLSLAIINILKNCIDAIEHENGNIQVKSYLKGNEVNFEIRDNGKGMTLEEINILGEPRYQLHEKGTGLGLMTAFSIIYAHGGDIFISSKPKKGTTFIVSLPGYKKEGA